MISVFGLGDFEKCKTTGNYAVGHRVHYLSNQTKNAVGVFYPVDKSYEESVKKMKMKKTFKPMIDYKNLKTFWNGKKEAIEWISLKPTSMKIFQFWNEIITPAISYADLSEDFASGREKLIPIVFCHGLCASRVDHNLAGLEMASHGYIVFMIDL